MTVPLHTWATRWGVPLEAIRELQILQGLYTPPLPPEAEAHGKSEAWVQSLVRLEASQKGLKMWRNNSGALQDKTGRLVRYGLANDSAAINAVLKSHDLIGIRKVPITQAMVGTVIGQFVTRECKPPDWQYTGDDHEVAQLGFGNLINSMGGDAAFVTGEGSL